MANIMAATGGAPSGNNNSKNDKIDQLILAFEGLAGALTSNNENINKRISGVEGKVDAFTDQVKALDQKFDNEDVSNRQRIQLRKAVTRTVYQLIGIPINKADQTIEDKVIMQKYSKIFHQRCYSEVSKLGHLAQPYGETTKANFAFAINDIEGWVPSNGVSGLKKEADDLALARKIAKEQGY